MASIGSTERTLYGGPGDGLTVSVSQQFGRLRVHLTTRLDPKLTAQGEERLKFWDTCRGRDDSVDYEAVYVWCDRRKVYVHETLTA